MSQAIEDSGIGVAIAESRYAFPIIEGIHLIALSVSVGLIFLTDLRLIGVFLKHIPAEDIHRQLRPFVFGGFTIVFLSGGLLFWAEAATVMQSPPLAIQVPVHLAGGTERAVFRVRDRQAARGARRAGEHPTQREIRRPGVDGAVDPRHHLRAAGRLYPEVAVRPTLQVMTQVDILAWIQTSTLGHAISKSITCSSPDSRSYT